MGESVDWVHWLIVPALRPIPVERQIAAECCRRLLNRNPALEAA
jgi:hypothetical protein